MSDSKLADKEAGLAYSPVEKQAQRGSRRTKQWIGWFACVALLFWRMSSSIERVSWSAGFDDEKACPQEAPLVPAASISSTLEGIYSTETFLNRSAAWLSGAVKIPTESYDDLLPVGSDPRWDIFAKLHAYLRVAFPRTFATAHITAVNTYGLAIHWQGSDESLKPILLSGHQDVVPVEPSTVSSWTHPPYSGYFDGKYVWGRGSIDDKSGLIGILSSIETLIEAGFKPRRTVVVASGIDEEAAGRQGAGALAVYLESTYGKDGFALLVDEGGGIAERSGVLVAAPDVGEKGYLDVRIQVSTPGGHSSVPPAHTGIGLLALAIQLIEQHPHHPRLSRASPFYSSVVCLAENAPEFNKPLRRLVEASLHSDVALGLLQEALANDPENGAITKALLSTTQAVDLVEGGVKVNALPERSSAVVNHRISADSSVSELIDHLTTLFAPFAKYRNLDFISFGKNISSASTAPSSGTFEIFDAFHSALEPAPITPTDTEAYRLLSGTILATHAKSVFSRPDAPKDLIVTPFLAGGNTDTQFYWNLTRNIFRYNHIQLEDDFGGIHTVNEAIPAKAFVDGIRFFTLLILNADESNAL